MRFAISFNRFNRVLLTLLLAGPKHAAVTVEPRTITVRMGIYFVAVVPRQNIADAGRHQGTFISAGAHGWRGRWLVNGSSQGLVRLRVEPPATARLLGLPITLRELIVSLVEPDEFLAALAADGPAPS